MGTFRAAAMHGDLDQHSRMETLAAFKSGQVHVLVATDMASRGLDIRSVRTVINFEPPKDTDAYVHRVGRTGRAGDKDGTAYTLLTSKDPKFAGELVQILAASNQEVPQAVHDLATKHGRGRKGQGGGKGKGAGRGRKAQVGGAGLGFGAPSVAPGRPTMSGFAPATPSADAGDVGGMQGFSRSTLESNDNLTSAPAPPPPAFAAAGSGPAAVATAPWQAASGAAAVDVPPLPPLPPDAPPPLPTAAASAAAAPLPGFGTQAGARAQIRQMQRGKFQSGFVSSGTQGGDINAKATIVRAKQQPARNVMPAPLPVSALPFTPASSFSSTSFRSAPPAAAQSAGQALSAAQAIAARLSGAATGAAAQSQSFTPAMPASAPSSESQYPSSQHRATSASDTSSYNQQPYQYPSQPGTGSSADVSSAAAQASIAKAQQAASAMFARFQQQNFPQSSAVQLGSQPPQPQPQPKSSRAKWDQR